MRLALSSLLLCAAPVLACGPQFPNTILDDEAAVLAAPVANFKLEIDRIKLPNPPHCRALPPRENSDEHAQTLEADHADLRAALLELKTPPAKADALLAQYAGARKEGKMPEGLPAEFADYLRGAIATNENEKLTAWQALLKRPESERRYRSTWAAFMIGKTLLAEKPALSVKWFAMVRDLDGKGFTDSLGLASSSLGWEARAELKQHHYDRAMELYLLQHATGDPTAVNSLRRVMEKLLAEKPAVLRRVASSAAAQQVVTAYFVSSGEERSKEWLKAMEAAGTKALGADRLAWAAYQTGDMEAARRWLARATEESAITQWLRVKLLLRDGRMDEATALLAALARKFPEEKDWSGARKDESPESRKAVEQVAGELGELQLSRGQSVDALDLLLRAGYWTDAAYGAERVLNLDELIGYANRTDSEDMRYLTARRLARAGWWKEAREYYPEKLRPILDEYAECLQKGRDQTQPVEARAAFLWEAAKTTRRYGMALLSTEAEPDWHYGEGSFDLGSTSSNRWERASAGERERLQQHQLPNERRFQYRYLAADLAWEAAVLLPDEAPGTARILCEAGSWIKDRDPKFADRFYKALARRCGTTELGREADKKRWFPKRPES